MTTIQAASHINIFRSLNHLNKSTINYFKNTAFSIIVSSSFKRYIMGNYFVEIRGQTDNEGRM